ncbi:MAG: hypothetical protein ACK42D_05000, partial [Candidatus Paceibacteria bacterium]
GYREAAHYKTLTKEMKRALIDLRFKVVRGLWTDIAHLCPWYNRGGVNLSVGYYNNHTTREYLDIDHLLTTLNAIPKLIERLGTESQVLNREVEL